MYIKLAPRTRRGWTLPEMLMAVGIFALGSAALMLLYLYSARGMASMCNYSLLDKSNREAMDLLTKEIRQAMNVLNYTTNSITILTTNTAGTTPTVTYSFSPSNKTMTRTSTDGTSKILLRNCNLLSFQLFTRCPSNGVFGSFPVATSDWSNTVKVVQLTWKTSMRLPTGVVNSENIQTARIVIRKQQNS
jgi:prepilin-type N-terminal cleavage/methylation domain-containing protein